MRDLGKFHSRPLGRRPALSFPQSSKKNSQSGPLCAVAMRASAALWACTVRGMVGALPPAPAVKGCAHPGSAERGTALPVPIIRELQASVCFAQACDNISLTRIHPCTLREKSGTKNAINRQQHDAPAAHEALRLMKLRSRYIWKHVEGRHRICVWEKL